MLKHAKTFRMGRFSFISLFDEVNRELYKGEKRNRAKAVSHVARKLRQEIKARYGKGNLYKGVGTANEETQSQVGYHHPAQHAHLIEFGTDQRFVQNWMRTGRAKDVGSMKKRPLFVPILERETPKVKEILSQPWVE